MKNQKILFITPPFTQLNTPYPATAYLKGFLNTKGIESFQCDLGIEVILKLFSSNQLSEMFGMVESKEISLSKNGTRILSLKKDYINVIDQAITFLQGKNPTLAHLIIEGDYLPEASRFEQIEDLDWAFGSLGIQDKAKHLVTLFLEDLSDFIIEAVDHHFGFSRYAEKLALSPPEFHDLNNDLENRDTFIDTITLGLLKNKIEKINPSIVCFSIPFPGNLYSGLKCGGWIKSNYPDIKIVLGGGYANTELRSVTEHRLFNYIDYITLDDGETPLLNLLEFFDGSRPIDKLKRTFYNEDKIVKYANGSADRDVPHKDVGTPDYSDLILKDYLSVIETANPMHRLWSDGRWNKLTLAHGCYWGKCTFCDTSLDYIGRYEPITAKLLCDRIETIIEQTGETGFHFVDEAAPPALMKELALEILRRGLTISWWTNIRFEKSFTFNLCRLLKKSGCIAVTGGLEVASDRLLKLIEKGVTIEQVTKVSDNFTEAGVMVHAYLMYGFPTETEQETIDSLEVVRQMFLFGVIQSAYWHRFAMTVHSPVGIDPEKFGVSRVDNNSGSFANNDLLHNDPDGADHSKFGEGLRKSLYNFMHGIGHEYSLDQWFDFKVPKTKINPNLIERAINSIDQSEIKSDSKIFWLGNNPNIRFFDKNKKGNILKMAEITFHNKKEDVVISLEKETGEWLCRLLNLISVNSDKSLTFGDIKILYQKDGLKNFDQFWLGQAITTLKESELIIL